MKSLRPRRVLSALLMTVAALGATVVASGTANAADSYWCKTSITYHDFTALGCIHLGGNGYWQPFVQVTDANVHHVTGLQWINSNGTDGDFSTFDQEIATGRIWGTSTNWRVSCYVQAQADVNVDGVYIGRVYSTSQNVC